ncbi:MAG: glutathione S-transferase family protein [Nevskia sp.]
MILIGMFDSPFVRRVAVSLRLLGMPFEHRNWSIGKDFERIREYNPLGRVPTLVLDDGEALAESAAILDYLDELAGPGRALLPAQGADRRRALQLMALGSGACEKGVIQIYERVFRPAEKVHEPWLARCRTQVHESLRALDAACAGRAGAPALVGACFGQADITAAVAHTFLTEALQLPADRYPALAARAARCEALPAFAEFHVPFFRPGSKPATS